MGQSQKLLTFSREIVPWGFLGRDVFSFVQMFRFGAIFAEKMICFLRSVGLVTCLYGRPHISCFYFIIYLLLLISRDRILLFCPGWSRTPGIMHPSCLSLLVSGTTGVNHHTQLVLFEWFTCLAWFPGQICWSAVCRPFLPNDFYLSCWIRGPVLVLPLAFVALAFMVSAKSLSQLCLLCHVPFPKKSCFCSLPSLRAVPLTITIFSPNLLLSLFSFPVEPVRTDSGLSHSAIWIFPDSIQK